MHCFYIVGYYLLAIYLYYLLLVDIYSCLFYVIDY